MSATYTVGQLVALTSVIASTPQTLIVLWLVDSHPEPETLGWLAKRMSQSTAGITGLVDNLEAHGWVERVRTDVDRRRVMARLTEKGLAAIALATNGGASQP